MLERRERIDPEEVERFTTADHIVFHVTWVAIAIGVILLCAELSGVSDAITNWP